MLRASATIHQPMFGDAKETMATRPLICGWVSFGSATPPTGKMTAMLSAEQAALSNARVASGERFHIAATCPTASIAVDEASGRVTLIKGRPQWHEAKWAKTAAARGAAHALLEAFESLGAECLQYISGNFALAVLDPRAETALLAIDRIGVERLCFARCGSLLVFATSARAVAAHPDVRAGLSNQALYEYLFCHMVPSPDTAFEGVSKLLPAEFLALRAGTLERRHYWQLAYPDSDGAADDVLQRRFVELTRRAVERQLDDKATGAFLSGGTDSSTITGMLGDVTGRPAEAFSIGFDAHGYDELEFARITARHFRANAHEFYVTPDHAAEAIPLIASAYDEPFGNASAAPTYFCARLAREHGIEVMLAGDGGDEFFGGNERYAKQGVFEHYQRVPAPLRRSLEPLMLRMPFAQAVTPLRKAQSYVRQARIPLPERLETYNFLHRTPPAEIFEPAFLQSVDTDRPLALMREAFFRCASAHPVERMMHLDHKVTLADNDVRKVTRMCELADVEVRFPLMDDDLVAFSGTLSPRHKIDRGRLRVLFKDALRGYLPSETITKSKHGFGLPFGIWLKEHTALRDIGEQALSRLARRGIVTPEYIARLRLAHANESPGYYGVMIWVLIHLELWLQANEALTAR